MCGLFGFSDYGHKLSISQINSLVEELADESTVRGTDATGISYIIDGKLEIEKEAKSAYLMNFKLPKDTVAVTGHTRHSTQGSSKKRYNNHPFRGRLQDGGMFALAHNGIIGNDVLLRKKYNLPDTKIETDSYIAVQLLEREKKLSFESLKNMAEDLSGSFAFSVLDDRNNIYLIRGENPLSVLHLTGLNVYVYASTDQILWRALSASLLSELKSGRFEEVHIEEGEILRLSPDGIITRGEFECLSDCFMPGAYRWWDFGYTHTDDEDYVAELKSLSGSFGYTPDDIDFMLKSGYSQEEIEELFYCEDFQR